MIKLINPRICKDDQVLIRGIVEYDGHLCRLVSSGRVIAAGSKRSVVLLSENDGGSATVLVWNKYIRRENVA
jgi:hypothetical protein